MPASAAAAKPKLSASCARTYRQLETATGGHAKASQRAAVLKGLADACTLTDIEQVETGPPGTTQAIKVYAAKYLQAEACPTADKGAKLCAGWKPGTAP